MQFTHLRLAISQLEQILVLSGEEREEDFFPSPSKAPFAVHRIETMKPLKLLPERSAAFCLFPWVMNIFVIQLFNLDFVPSESPGPPIVNNMIIALCGLMPLCVFNE